MYRLSSARSTSEVGTGKKRYLNYSLDSQRSHRNISGSTSTLNTLSLSRNRVQSTLGKDYSSLSNVQESKTIQKDNSLPDIQKRARYDPEVRAQLVTIKANQISSHNVKNFLLKFQVVAKQITQQIILKHFTRLPQVFQELLEDACRTKQTRVLMELCHVGAKVFQSVQNYPLAIFLYKQLRSMGHYLDDSYSIYKMKSLYGLARCAHEQQRYEIAIKIYKKCLQYAWKSRNDLIEIDVYEQLSLSYFYLGQLKKVSQQQTQYQSQFYHERAHTYDYELDSSTQKQMSVEILNTYLEKNYPICYGDELTVALINKTELPLSHELFYQDVTPPEDLDIKEFSIMGSSNDTQLSQRKRRLSKHKHREAFYYKREVINPTLRSLQTLDLEGKDQLQPIILEKEFEYEVYTPKHSFRQQTKCLEFLKRAPTIQEMFHDPALQHIRYNQSDLGVIVKKDIIKENSQKLKLPLNRQISNRLKKSYNHQSLISRLQAQTRLGFQQSKPKDKICVTHRENSREKSTQVVKERLRRNDIDKLLNGMIDTLLDAHNS